MRQSFILLLAISPLFLSAQEYSLGDSSVMAEILKKLSAQYGTQDTTLHHLTKKQLLHSPVNGTEISVDIKKGAIMRVVLWAASGEGMFSEEYIFYDRKLMMVYQSFEFFLEVKTNSRFINIKGARGWETRYFFVDEKLAFQKTSGAKQTLFAYGEKELMQEKNRLIEFIRPLARI